MGGKHTVSPARSARDRPDPLQQPTRLELSHLTIFVHERAGPFRMQMVDFDVFQGFLGIDGARKSGKRGGEISRTVTGLLHPESIACARQTICSVHARGTLRLIPDHILPTRSTQGILNNALS